MNFALLSILFAPSIKSTIASSVRDDLNLGQIDAWNPINLDTLQLATKQPPLYTDFSQPKSQLLAAKSKPDAPVLEPIEDSAEQFQQPYSDSLASLGSNKSPLASTPSQQVAVDTLQETDFHTRHHSPPSSLVASKDPDRKKPECDSISQLYCCFGEVRIDESGNMFVATCFSCKNPISSIFCFCIAQFLVDRYAEDTDRRLGS